MNTNSILLTIFMLLWCLVHSALISIPVVSLAQKRLGRLFKFYRLFYNMISVLTLLPILIFMLSIRHVSYFNWPGLLRIVQGLLLVGCLFLLFAGARHYDGMQFLGLRQILSNKHSSGLTSSGGLHTEGILNVIRHPWYVAGLLLVWAREIDSVSLPVNIVFSVYLIVGAMLEERKLVLEFGQDYKDYQHRVSMFFPWKWIVGRLRR